MFSATTHTLASTADARHSKRIPPCAGFASSCVVAFLFHGSTVRLHG